MTQTYIEIEGAGKPKTPRLPPKGYELVDSEPQIGVVRCDRDDLETFWTIAARLVERQGYAPRPGMLTAEAVREVIREPEWEWLRFNPVGEHHCLDWSWTLGRPGGPGRGNWLGALVVLK